MHMPGLLDIIHANDLQRLYGTLYMFFQTILYLKKSQKNLLKLNRKENNQARMQGLNKQRCNSPWYAVMTALAQPKMPTF
jgi:hypothetical protein